MKARASSILTVASLLLAAPAAMATTYTVGTDPGCQYSNLRDALNAASNNAAGPHLIKVAKATDTSLSYSGGSPDSAFSLDNPKADITIEGGYVACGKPVPSSNGYTTLSYEDPMVDVDYTMLTIRNDYDNPRRTVTLRRLRLSGASASSSQGPDYGGGIFVSSNVSLRLGYGTWVSSFDARTGGGGVALFGWVLFAPIPVVDEYPELVMVDGASVRFNQSSRNGGGVYSYVADVVLQGGRIKYNKTLWNGGGIYAVGFSGTPDHDEILLLDAAQDNQLSYNQAGQSADFTTVRGYGGAIYSLLADIHTPYAYDQSHEFVGNKANYGGAVYVEGANEPAGGPFTQVWLNDALFQANAARGRGGALYSLNAVDWFLGSSGVGPGPDGKIGPFLLFYQNGASTLGDSAGFHNGGVAFITDERSDGASRGIMRFQRAWFLENEDVAGKAAVAAAGSGGEMRFWRSIFDGNQADAFYGDTTQLYVTNNDPVRVTYSTGVNNTTDYFFKTSTPDVIELNLQGSILWSPATDTLVYNSGNGSIDIRTGGCLISFYGDVQNDWDRDPQLDKRYAPAGSSPALDNCDSLNFEPIMAVGLHSAYDVPGVSARFSGTAPWNWDLGAVEQTDIIFANHFGYRPTN